MNTKTLTRFSSRLAAIVILLVAPFHANAAMYMQVEGVDGDVTADGYENWIALNVLSEGLVVNVGSFASGPSRDVSRPDFSDVAVSKALDKTSPFLRQKLTAGKPVGTVTIVMVQTGGDTAQEFFKIVLTNAILTSISMSGSVDVPIEQVTMGFEKVEWTYTDNGKDGTGAGTKYEAGYDLALNQKI